MIGHADGAGDLLDRGDQLGDGEMVAVGIAVRPGDGGARCGDGLGAGVLHDARGRSVPRIGEDEEILVQRMEGGGVLGRAGMGSSLTAMR